MAMREPTYSARGLVHGIEFSALLWLALSLLAYFPR
jgi:hypothetical protein